MLVGSVFMGGLQWVGFVFNVCNRGVGDGEQQQTRAAPGLYMYPDSSSRAWVQSNFPTLV